ncbi:MULTISPECIES: ABC transporter ATP-binding protein [Deefgea]|uniref:ATP-binding cassette domain-containing protein n=1 Tax=Deefgea chitinilytica TaxID=570276 RepID=A0ABS2C777_9NEIS|nr:MULTISPECIES: ABC transporter ATP-binding protein [Deefgea]MBM5570015.1 ATP-binding cassette domain-containing protein [Deefgea chitinilytica]MBM9887244.1 ABC transporter ATP-binding protein [Deefgea sp. CFH1-16]
MSSDFAIKVENLSKCYHIYDKPRDRLMQMLLRGKRKYFREFWALKDVSFEIKKGETVGIIGRNGSGKSTLLQLICGTLNPTQGEIKTNGRVAALLELGAGFNPEFSGRENVYMNGAILGLSREEIEERFDSIVEFADIGDFIDQPVKNYSSGMGVRLAFAVAINVDPQILIVDEALSVGDELFQRKCFSRIEAIRAKGATILFVSHSGGTIVELCDRAILIDAGELLVIDRAKPVVGSYQKLLYAPSDKYFDTREDIKDAHVYKKIKASNNLEIENGTDFKECDLEECFDENLKPLSTIEYESSGPLIGDAGIYNLEGVKVNSLVSGRRYVFKYDVDFMKVAFLVRFGMSIKTLTGFSIGGALSAFSAGKAISKVELGSRIQVAFEFDCNLNAGTFFMNAGVFGCMQEDLDETILHRKTDIIAFRVLPLSDCYETEPVCFKFFPVVSINA